MLKLLLETKKRGIFLTISQTNKPSVYSALYLNLGGHWGEKHVLFCTIQIKKAGSSLAFLSSSNLIRLELGFSCFDSRNKNVDFF